MIDMNNNKSIKGKYSEHLRNFINNTLEEDKLNSYELSRRIGCSETVLRSFLDGKTKTLNSEAVVALANYKKVPLDEVVGRSVKEPLHQMELQNQTLVKTKNLPAFLSNLDSSELQEIIQIREGIKKFKHFTPPNEEPSKQNKKPSKSDEQSR